MGISGKINEDDLSIVGILMLQLAAHTSRGRAPSGPSRARSSGGAAGNILSQNAGRLSRHASESDGAQGEPIVFWEQLLE
jgi:hypothetical protein